MATTTTGRMGIKTRIKLPPAAPDTTSGVTNPLSEVFQSAAKSGGGIQANAHPEYGDDYKTPLDSAVQGATDLYHKGAAFMGNIAKMFTGGK